MSQKNLNLSDSVLIRIVQIVQESMLLGVDACDLMRMIRLCPDDQNVNQLVLTPEYEKQVESMHEAWLSKAETLQREQQEGESLVVDDETASKGILFN